MKFKYKQGDKIFFSNSIIGTTLLAGKTATVDEVVDGGYRVGNYLVRQDELEAKSTKVKNYGDKHDVIKQGNKKGDTIHPNYYKFHGFDVFDIAAYFRLDFPTGNALKYLLRAGHKDPTKKAEDLRKCIQCIQRSIEIMEGKQCTTGETSCQK